MPLLALTLARISGRAWKYSSRSEKKASFSCEESLVNTIGYDGGGIVVDDGQVTCVGYA